MTVLRPRSVGVKKSPVGCNRRGAFCLLTSQRFRYGGHCAHIDLKRLVLRYRSPRSGRITTINTDSSSDASLSAPTTAAPPTCRRKFPHVRQAALRFEGVVNQLAMVGSGTVGRREILCPSTGSTPTTWTSTSVCWGYFIVLARLCYSFISPIVLKSLPPLYAMKNSTCRLRGRPGRSPQSRKSVLSPKHLLPIPEQSHRPGPRGGQAPFNVVGLAVYEGRYV